MQRLDQRLVQPRTIFAALVLGSMGFLASCGQGESQGPGDNSTPITERPSRATSSCRVARDRTDHTPRSWQSSPALATTSGGATYLFRHEAMRSNPLMPVTAELLVGSLNADGVFGAASVVPSSAATIGQAAAAPRGDGFAVVWSEGDKLRFAAFDAGGAATVAARDVATGTQSQAFARIAAGPDGGFGVVYVSALTTSAQQADFLVLNADGVARGPARRLDQAGAAMAFAPNPGPAIVGGPSGYAMIWRNLADANGGIDFAKADADGVEIVARRRISPGTAAGGSAGGFESPVNALLETSAGYLAAWVQAESHPSAVLNRGASATVWLARLDPSGERQGPPAPLRAPTDSVDEVEPSLVRYGDAVAVLWGHGSHIYVCGGCVPDHRIDLLLIDPTDLVPLSNVVSVTNGGPSDTPGGMPRGGLLRRQVAVMGKSILTTFDLTFHTYHSSSSATFACDP